MSDPWKPKVGDVVWIPKLSKAGIVKMTAACTIIGDQVFVAVQGGGRGLWISADAVEPAIIGPSGPTPAEAMLLRVDRWLKKACLKNEDGWFFRGLPDPEMGAIAEAVSGAVAAMRGGLQ